MTTLNEVPGAGHAVAPTAPSSALIHVAGADARTFLDSQLTRNVPADGFASLAGYCSPKGRLLATFVVWPAAGGVRLLVTGDIAEAIAKRLRMYVLRAKATITLDADPAVERLVDAASAPPLAVWATGSDGAATWIRYPDADGHARHLRIGATDPDPSSVDPATWRWLDIRAGLPSIVGATQERFVPQMVNLEALGGVDFKKGCFPGQEIVARSQYLGKLKRRMALGSVAGDRVPAAGEDVWQADDAAAIGLVVAAERGPDGHVTLLVELPLAAFASDALTIGGPDGPSLTLEPLPYALPDNEVFVRPKL